MSGHGKNGALCVLQSGVRPQVVTTFELPGCLDMWTVLAKQEVYMHRSLMENSFCFAMVAKVRKLWSCCV